MRKDGSRSFISICRLSAIILALMMTVRCTFEEPQAPTWDVYVTVPLVSKTFTVSEMAEDSDWLDTQGSQVILTFEQEMNPFQLAENLTADFGTHTISIVVPHPTPAGSHLIQDNFFTLPDTVVITHADIRSGRMIVTAHNPTDYTYSAGVNIPALQKYGSTYPLSISNIPPGNSSTEIVLDGTRLVPGSNNRLDYHADMTVLTQGTYGGTVILDLFIQDPVFDSVTGVFDHLRIELEDSESELNIPEELRNFQLGSANMKLALRAGFDMSKIFVDMEIEGLDPANGGPVTLSVIDSLMDEAPAQGIFTDTLFVSNVHTLINSMPGRIRFGGRIEIGDGTPVQSTVHDTSTVAVTASFIAPMTFSLPADSTEAPADTLDLDEDARKSIQDNLKSIGLEATVSNHFPFGMGVAFFFDDDSLVYVNPRLKVGPLTVASGTVSGGHVTAPVESVLSFRLTEEDLELFQEETIYMGMRLIFPGTAGMVTVETDDYITVEAYLAAKVHVDFSEDEE